MLINKYSASKGSVKNLNMNFVGRQSLHLDNVNKPSHIGGEERCFGKDITNMLGGNALGKGSIKHKRTTSEYVPNKNTKA